ncbi:blastula protease 10-like [Macrobrachium rosenbergii]|uniref:blastula protease 10-like n=1 Tax=Macrobrachium rosenbergii TaxID=79674 RepID=UPI0034D3D538
MFTPPNNAEAVRIPMKEDLGGFENVNPTHVNGEELFESDILLSPEQRRQFLDRKAIPSLSSRWPNGPNGTPVVPYQFGDTAVSTTAVEAGLAHWKEHTCIDFQLITGTPPSSYLNFIKGSGCWSYVGMQPSPQDLSIGTGCSSLGTVAHEVGHAMGFFHEQSRSDRDGYVTIILANVQAGKEGNFQKSVDNNYSLPYDFSSDMHYGSNYFSVNGKNTIVTKNPLAQELIGNRYGLSHYDKLLANTMYPCITKWMQNCGITTNPCQNDGYVGKNCSCVCRSGTSGTHCETVTQIKEGDFWSLIAFSQVAQQMSLHLGQPETTSTSASVSTTTSTSTSTSASTTSTATSTGDACGVAELGPGAIEWTSPNFGLGKYPNGESCALSVSSLITTGDVGDTGTIAAPRQPNYTWQKKACEFWIRSPIGTRIQLDFTSMVMSVDCRVNSVVVNGAGDVTYPSGSSDRYCGTSLPPSTTSAANEMNVLFFSKRAAKLFSATWTVVSA